MTEITLRLALSRITVLRPREKLQVEEIVDSESFFCSLTSRLLSQIVGRRVSDLAQSPEMLLRAAERDLVVMRSRGIRALHINDENYPPLLREIYDPPYLLYLRGRLPNSDSTLVAVVGTREPTAVAAQAAYRLGEELADAGAVVVSGLARGIDFAAHGGAIAGGLTGAVLAGGLDDVYPRGHRQLAAQVLDRGGFLVSEYAPGVSPLKYHFPARNRIISGVARAVVVVQAPAKSGAIITSEYALDQGRDLVVHADGLNGPHGEGTADLAADGALIIRGAADLLTEWGWERVQRRRTEEVSSVPTTVQSAAVAQVSRMRSLLQGGER